MSINLYDGLTDLKNRQEKIIRMLSEILEGSCVEKFYDLADLQKMLNVSRRTIASWTKEGSLPHTKKGNKIWVTEEQLNLFLDEHSSKAGTDLKIRKGGSNE